MRAHASSAPHLNAASTLSPSRLRTSPCTISAGTRGVARPPEHLGAHGHHLVTQQQLDKLWPKIVSPVVLAVLAQQARTYRDAHNAPKRLPHGATASFAGTCACTESHSCKTLLRLEITTTPTKGIAVTTARLTKPLCLDTSASFSSSTGFMLLISLGFTQAHVNLALAGGAVRLVKFVHAKRLQKTGEAS